MNSFPDRTLDRSGFSLPEIDRSYLANRIDSPSTHSDRPGRAIEVK
ncbi:hypothetical protein V0288_04635 [Pannus brasiliensis CCIBt3594]|uniref:Uncharacterized protein n=1 Tax=Pannus brasiliensis CCIBt3594 TaxID=1427578 RepID=A0AAW9QSE1_9CHRO